MGNEIRAKYSADISQLEIANDKLTAQNEKLSRQVATMTAKASGFNKTYGNSWNAVRARVEEYTRAVKGATNLREWYGAIEKLQGAQKEYEEINARVDEFTTRQKEATVAVVHMVNSSNDLADRLKNVRTEMQKYDASTDEFRKLALEEGKVLNGLKAINNEAAKIQLQSEFNGSIKTADQLGNRISNLRKQYKLMDDADPAKSDLASKIDKMQQAYDRLTASTATSTQSLDKNEVQVRAAADGIAGLTKQIEYLEQKTSLLSGSSAQFDKLSAAIARLKKERKGLIEKHRVGENRAPETFTAAMPLDSLEAKRLQRDYLQNASIGTGGKQFEEMAAKIRVLNAEIVRMETLWRKAEQEITLDPVVLNSVDGLTQRIAHLQEVMNKVDNGKPLFAVNRNTGNVEQSGTTAKASKEYMAMAETVVRLKKELKGLKDLQNIPVEQVVTARKSYDALREAIDRTKKARDGAVKGSPEFNALEDKLQKLEAGYKRLTASSDAHEKAGRKHAETMRVDSKSVTGLSKQIEFLQGKLDTLGKGAEFDRLAKIVAKLQVRLKATKEDAAKFGSEMSKAATAPVNSFMRLDYELKKAKADLIQLTFGTKEFVAQQAKVKELAKMWGEVDQAINKTEKAQKKSTGLMGTMTGQAKSLVATYIGIHQVMTEITAEWEKQRQFQLDVANKGAANQGELVKQAPNIGGENLKGVAKWARDNQVEMLGKQADIIRLIGEAQSSGAKTLDEAKGAVKAAMKISVGDPEMASETLKGGITIARLNNSKDYESAIGQIRSSSRASQATDEAEFLGNVMGKMAALTRGRKNMDGMSTERALEYVSAASRIQVDATGDSSSTNMQAIFSRMDEFFPELKKKLKDGTMSVVTQQSIDAFKAARSFDEKMNLLRGNNGLRSQLGDQWVDKQRTGGPKELAWALLDNQPNVQKIMKETEAAVVPFAAGGAEFKAATKQLHEAVPALIAQRKMQAGSEQSATDDRTVALATARATYDAIWNADAAGNAPKNLSGWDRGKRMLAGIEIYGASGDKALGLGKGGPRTEVEAMMKAVQMLIREETGAAALADLKSKLDVLQDISRTLQSIDAKTNGEKLFGDQQRQMMPPLGWKPRVLAPAAAAAAAAVSKR